MKREFLPILCWISSLGKTTALRSKLGELLLDERGPQMFSYPKHPLAKKFRSSQIATSIRNATIPNVMRPPAILLFLRLTVGSYAQTIRCEVGGR